MVIDANIPKVRAATTLGFFGMGLAIFGTEDAKSIVVFILFFYDEKEKHKAK